MSVVDELIAVLGYEIEGEDKLKKFDKSLDQSEKKARDRARNDEVRFRARRRRDGKQWGYEKQRSAARAGIGRAARYGGAAAAYAVTKGFTKYAALERRMKRVGITAGATDKQITDATSSIWNYADKYRIPLDTAVRGFEELVAIGYDFKSGMAFLPSVLATTQAAGADVVDIANTAEKSSKALHITADQMQLAFDIMVAGGKAGQFELKDMAQHIPQLSNMFSGLGYKGIEGLQKLIAILQTLREDTGTAGQAATQAQALFTKMDSAVVSKSFKKFGIDLDTELKKARDSGEDVIQTFLKLTNKAIGGDLTKIPKLFDRIEMQSAVRSLLTSMKSYEKFLKAVNTKTAVGGTLRDLSRVTSDAQAKIDRLGLAWDRLMTQLGSKASSVLSPVLDVVSDVIDADELIDKQLEKEGKQSTWGKYLPGSSVTRARAYERAIAEKNKQTATLPIAPPPKDVLTGSSSLNTKGPSNVSSPHVTLNTPKVDLSSATLSSVTPPSLEPVGGGAPAPQGGGVASNVGDLRSSLANMSERLRQITPSNAAGATITDARQDNRNQSMTNNISVHQTVTSASEAPGAAAQATGAAVGQAAAAQRSQVAGEPSF